MCIRDRYLTGRPLVFLYNTLLISICYLLVYLVKRKAFAAILVSFVWLAGGIANGVILANRVTPLTGPDLKLFKDALEAVSYTHLDVYKRQVPDPDV